MSSGLKTPSGGIIVPAPMPLRAKLRITAVGGPHDGEKWDISSPMVTIGRDHRNDIVLHRDGGVSRAHMTLRFDAGRWFARDEGSSNGTFLCLASQLCRVGIAGFELPGDSRIQAGATQLKIELVR